MTAVETWGLITVVGAAACWALGSFLSSRIPIPGDAFVATTWEMLTGGLALLVVGIASGEGSDFALGDVAGEAWAWLVYLVLIGSIVAFSAYVWLLQHAPISLTATYAYVNPVVAVALGALVLSEPITASVVMGGAVVVLGVGLVVTAERPRRDSARAAGVGNRLAPRRPGCAGRTGGRPSDMTQLVLGPLLRHVGHTDATVWVETDGSCTVEVLGHTEDTFLVAGHHYALVCIEGLEPGSSTAYDVKLDGDDGLAAARGRRRGRPPPSRIRTISEEDSAPGGLRVLPLRAPRRGRRRRQLRGGRAGHLRQADGRRCPSRSGRTRCCCSATRSTPTRRRSRTAGAHPRAARRQPGAGRADQGLRGVHLALRGVLDRPRRALAAVDDPVVDDLRRPRRRRRLEHLGACGAPT